MVPIPSPSSRLPSQLPAPHTPDDAALHEAGDGRMPEDSWPEDGMAGEAEVPWLGGQRGSPAGRGGCPTAGGCWQHTAAPAACGQHRPEEKGEESTAACTGKGRQSKRKELLCAAGRDGDAGVPARLPPLLLCNVPGGFGGTRQHGQSSRHALPAQSLPHLPLCCRVSAPLQPPQPGLAVGELRRFLPSVFINRTILGRSLR